MMLFSSILENYFFKMLFLNKKKKFLFFFKYIFSDPSLMLNQTTKSTWSALHKSLASLSLRHYNNTQSRILLTLKNILTYKLFGFFSFFQCLTINHINPQLLLNFLFFICMFGCIVTRGNSPVITCWTQKQHILTPMFTYLVLFFSAVAFHQIFC